MIKKAVLPWMAVALLALGACSGQKGPADEVISAAESALMAVKDDAAKYVPNELASVQDKLTALKDSLANKDYKAVVDAGPDINSAIDKLKTDVAAMVEQMKREAEAWGGLAADVPQMVSAIESRVKTLSSARRLPSSISSSAFESAKAGLEQIKTSWADAMSAHDQGEHINAAASARAAKAKGEEVLAMLGMKSG